MKNTFKLEALSICLSDKKHFALPKTLLCLLFVLSIAVSQLPVTQAQEEDGQAGTGAFEFTVQEADKLDGAVVERNENDIWTASLSSIANPIPGNNNLNIPFQKWSWDEERLINVTLVNVITGSEANSIVQYENMYNDTPTSEQEWRIYFFDLTYVSGTTGSVLRASDVLYQSDFFRPTGSSLPIHDTATWSRDYRPYGIHRVELYPGGSSRVIVGLLVDKSEAVPLLRVPYDGGDSINWVRLADGPTTYTLTVNSANPASGVAITSTTGHDGTTSYTKSVTQATNVTLTAPQHVGSGAARKSFSSWSGGVSSTDRTITLLMNEAKTVKANYIDNPEYSSNADLSGLTVNKGTLIPSFKSTETTYTLSVAYDVDNISVSATLADEQATMRINNNEALSASPKTIMLGAVGTSTKIAIEVTAEDEATEKTYTITVNREAKPGIKLGDVSGSGTIDVTDVVLAMRFSLDIEIPTEKQKAAADINGDGKIDINDVVLIMRYALGLIDSF